MASVGDKWESKQGPREIVALREFENIGMRFAVSVNGRSAFPVMVKPEDIDNEIEFDGRALASYARTQARTAARLELAAREQAEHDNLNGFDANMSPLQRARAIKVLNVQQSYNGVFCVRKKYIEGAVASGSKVGYNDTWGRILEHTGGAFQAGLTKMELDYADYLNVQAQNRVEV